MSPELLVRSPARPAVQPRGRWPVACQACRQREAERLEQRALRAGRMFTCPYWEQRAAEAPRRRAGGRLCRPLYVRTCGRLLLVRMAYYPRTVRVQVLILYCKSMRCRRCRRIRLALLWARVRKCPDINVKLELTMAPRAWCCRWAAERGIYEAFKRLMKRIRRKFGGLQYFARLEWTRRAGVPHLHVLLRKAPFIEQAWLSASAEACGLGKVAWIASAEEEDRLRRRVVPREWWHVPYRVVDYVLGDLLKVAKKEVRSDYMPYLHVVRASRRFFDFESRGALDELFPLRQREMLKTAEIWEDTIVPGTLRRWKQDMKRKKVRVVVDKWGRRGVLVRFIRGTPPAPGAAANEAERMLDRRRGGR